jgi:hypothetical protein
MALPEQQSLIISESTSKVRADDLPRSEVARILTFVKGKYDFQRYLSPGADGRLNLPTALAAMHAIDAKGQQGGWDENDLFAAFSVTKVTLTTAGFANAKEGLHALLTGTTGELQDIMEKILPPDAPRGVQWIATAMVRANAVDNMRVVEGLLIDEKILERRLLQLMRIQQDIVIDPGKTRALLSFLNGDYPGFSPLAGSALPQEAKDHLVRISPFSLEDMKRIRNLFNAFEDRRNSEVQIAEHSLRIDTWLKKLDAAGINIAKLVSLGTESIVKNTLFIVGGTISGVGEGLILGSEKVVNSVGRAVNTVKQHNEERKAAQIQ